MTTRSPRCCWRRHSSGIAWTDGVRHAPWRAYWVASVAAGVSLFTVAAVLSVFGIIGRLIVG